MSVPTIADSCVEHGAGRIRIIHPAQAENDAGVGPRVLGWTIVEIKMANAMMRFVVDCVSKVAWIKLA